MKAVCIVLTWTQSNDRERKCVKAVNWLIYNVATFPVLRGDSEQKRRSLSLPFLSPLVIYPMLRNDCRTLQARRLTYKSKLGRLNSFNRWPTAWRWSSCHINWFTLWRKMMGGTFSSVHKLNFKGGGYAYFFKKNGGCNEVENPYCVAYLIYRFRYRRASSMMLLAL